MAVDSEPGAGLMPVGRSLEATIKIHRKSVDV
jgi:hypothetical protein